MRNEKIEGILKYFDENIKKEFYKIPKDDFNQIIEIRIRINQPIEIITKNRNLFLMCETKICKSTIVNILTRFCNFSLYSFDNDIKNGFITLPGGHRVGVIGSFVKKSSEEFSIKDISYMNIRINYSISDCSFEILEKIPFREKVNLLICGAPLSGKTTILKDLIQKLSDDYNFKINVLDERGEIANVNKGVIENYLGKKTDVFSYYPKKIGAIISIRNMSPDYIVMDEISFKDEIKEITQVKESGCSIIATLHYNFNYKNFEFFKKNFLKYEIFDYIVFLDNFYNVGKIKKIFRVR